MMMLLWSDQVNQNHRNIKHHLVKQKLKQMWKQEISDVVHVVIDGWDGSDITMPSYLTFGKL